MAIIIMYRTEKLNRTGQLLLRSKASTPFEMGVFFYYFCSAPSTFYWPYIVSFLRFFFCSIIQIGIDCFRLRCFISMWMDGNWASGSWNICLSFLYQSNVCDRRLKQISLFWTGSMWRVGSLWECWKFCWIPKLNSRGCRKAIIYTHLLQI